MKRLAMAAMPTAFLIGGCADYLNRYDTVTLAAGDANRQNLILQRVDNLNPTTENTRIEGDGKRAAAVIAAYRGGQANSGSRQDRDCAGGTGDNPVAPGPRPTGGSDPDRLDGDGDGIACE